MNRTRGNGTKFKFNEGERVLCFEPDPTKARVLYDAKVLEIRARKDSKGKKLVEYLIHFQGWNSSWDRYVAEAYILQDIEEHRLLQKELADTARSILKENRRKRQRIGAALRGAEPKFCNNDSESSSAEDGDSATRSSFEEDSPVGREGDGDETEVAEDSDMVGEDNEVVFHVPDSIKHLLEDDYINIKFQKKLLKIPCQTNAVTILENFVRNYATSLISTKNPDRSRASHRTNSTSSNTSSNAGAEGTGAGVMLSLCKEVIDGLRVSLDFLLELVLLYPEERPQYQNIKSKTDDTQSDSATVSKEGTKADHSSLLLDPLQWKVLPEISGSSKFQPSTVYGIVHLCRLLVKLPDVIQKMHLSKEKRRVVTNYADLLLQYIDKQKTLLTETDYTNLIDFA